MSPRTKRLAFIDVEASGLNEGSFPIEIGWAVLGGTAGGLLIRPDATWLHDAWDKTAEEQDMLDLLLNGGSRVSAENLRPVLEWCGR